MHAVQLPEGYQTIMPYLILSNALQFFEFTKEVFGAKEKMKIMVGEELMHGEITIGGSTIMFGNASEQWPVQTSGLYINVFNADEIFQKALNHGAKLLLPLSDQSYGRSGGVTDPFGNVWWITTPK